MIIRRVIKKWGGHGDFGGTSHEWGVEINMQEDLHRPVRPGHEVEDVLGAIQLVDQLLIGYVEQDLRPGEQRSEPETPGATYDPNRSLLDMAETVGPK